MKKIAVIGICGQSVFLKGEKLPEKGETLVFDNLHTEAGGKGVNAAATIARLKGNVSFLTALGDDFYAAECEKFFKDERLNVCVAKKHGVSTDYGVILTDKNGYNFVCVSTTASRLLTGEDVDSFATEISSADYLLMQAELSDEVLLKAAEIAMKSETKIVFDPSPVRKLPPEFLKSVWLFTPNETEESALFSQIKPEKCVVTLGENGAKFICGDKIEYFKAKKVKATNTTGAGDVFNGALLTALSKGEGVESAINYAIKAASFKVKSQYVVDGLPTENDLKNL